MLKYKSLLRLFIAIMLLFGGTAGAQLDGLPQKAKDKAGEIFEKKADKKKLKENRKKGSQATIAPGYFVQGDSLLFNENFVTFTAGSSVPSFKTNGAAVVATVEGQKGKWMVLRDKATFKLSKAIRYPKRFTVEFDILASGDNITDISPLSFGFATDNSASEYTSTAGTYVQLHYYDGDQVNVGSNNPQKFASTTYELSAGLNRPMHIALAVNGETLTVYLDGNKVADTILFSPGAAKNFYITAPWEYKNGAKVLVSNFKISAFTN